mmetsp:Transcript_76318/g.236937  ORF Transcript_76318/g.236937 Transcript_76318/m.236937 type:complete len:377 (-) Transcript_76318:682-1812(-)
MLVGQHLRRLSEEAEAQDLHGVQQEGAHPALALHLHAPGALEGHVAARRALAAGPPHAVGDVYPAGDACGLHAARRVHGVAEHAVARHLLADDTAHDPAEVYAHSDLHGATRALPGRGEHLPRGLDHLGAHDDGAQDHRKVRGRARAAAGGTEEAEGYHVRVPDRLDLVRGRRVALNDCVETAKQVVEHQHDLRRIGCLTQHREALHVREQDGHALVVLSIGELVQLARDVGWHGAAHALPWPLVLSRRAAAVHQDAHGDRFRRRPRVSNTGIASRAARGAARAARPGPLIRRGAALAQLVNDVRGQHVVEHLAVGRRELPVAPAVELHGAAPRLHLELHVQRLQVHGCDLGYGHEGLAVGRGEVLGRGGRQPQDA